MNDPTRRGFLAVSGVGAAAVAAAALAPRADAAAAESAAPAAALADSGDGPLVAYVDDPKSGRITLVAGESRAVVTDVALATSLARKAGRG